MVVLRRGSGRSACRGAGDLAVAREALVSRLSVELARPGGKAFAAVGTVEVGGLTKTGRLLERLLEAAYRMTCSAVGKDADAFQREHFPRIRRVSNCSSGQLSDLIRGLGASPEVVPVLAPILRDLERRDSAIQKVIFLRNETAHARDPGVDELRRALVGLRRLVLTLAIAEAQSDR